MTRNTFALALALVAAFLLGQLVQAPAHADGGGFDRALAERLVRALETIARDVHDCRK